jgi:hypothetical protein
MSTVSLPTENTFDDLTKFITEVFPNALIVATEGEIYIQTGLALDMGNLIYPIDEEELTEIRGN